MTDPQSDRALIAEAKGMYPPWDDGLTVAVFRILADRLEVLTDQLEKVKAVLSNAPECDEHDDNDPVTRGWKRDMIAARAILTEEEE